MMRAMLFRVLIVFAIVTVFFPRAANAYCRTTTCDPNAKDGECRVNASGCVRDGVAVEWESLPIAYRFSHRGSAKLDDAKMRAAVKAAFKTWENVKCADGRRTSVRFKEGSDVRSDKPLVDDEDTSSDKRRIQPFGIYFRDETWPHEGSTDSLALTNQSFGLRGGLIAYADIEVNTAEGDFSLDDNETDPLKPDFQAVMIHEVGHYLGLAHSLDPEAIMAPSYCNPGDERCKNAATKRQLSRDDIEGVCALYPPHGASIDDDDPEAASGCHQGPSSRTDLVSGIALAVVCSAILRRRTRSQIVRNEDR